MDSCDDIFLSLTVIFISISYVNYGDVIMLNLHAIPVFFYSKLFIIIIQKEYRKKTCWFSAFKVKV